MKNDDGLADASEKADGHAPDLPAAAKRALAEAAARRASAVAEEQPPEVNGRGGLDPTRYDDWEIKGLATDFS